MIKELLTSAAHFFQSVSTVGLFQAIAALVGVLYASYKLAKQKSNSRLDQLAIQVDFRSAKLDEETLDALLSYVRKAATETAEKKWQSVPSEVIEDAVSDELLKVFSKRTDVIPGRTFGQVAKFVSQGVNWQILKIVKAQKRITTISEFEHLANSQNDLDASDAKLSAQLWLKEALPKVKPDERRFLLFWAVRQESGMSVREASRKLSAHSGIPEATIRRKLSKAIEDLSTVPYSI